MNRKLPVSWIMALALALLLGVGSHAALVVPSVAQWDVDAARAVRAQSAWLLSYLVHEPRTGDRIADSVYLALAEGEDAWAVSFLERQHTVLQQMVTRSGVQDVPEREVAALTIQTLEHYQALIAAGQQDHTSFQRLTADQVGPQLHQQALHALNHLNK